MLVIVSILEIKKRKFKRKKKKQFSDKQELSMNKKKEKQVKQVCYLYNYFGYWPFIGNLSVKKKKLCKHQHINRKAWNKIVVAFFLKTIYHFKSKYLKIKVTTIIWRGDWENMIDKLYIIPIMNNWMTKQKKKKPM